MAIPIENELGGRIEAKLDSPLRMAGLAVLVAGAGYALAFAGDLFSLSHRIPAVLWPANAFQIALMLLLPRRTWPMLISAHAVGGLIHGFQIHLTALMTIMFTLADVVVFLIAGFGLGHAFGSIPRLDSIRALAKYFFIAVVLAPGTSAFLSGFGTPDAYWTSCRIWFLLNALTFLTLAPAIFSWVSPVPEWIRENPRWVEAGAQLGVLCLLGYIIFLSPWKVNSPALVYSLVPLFVWAALRFGSLGASSSMAIIAVLSVWGAVHGHGAFAGSNPQVNSVSLLLFLLFAVTPFMVLAALVEEHERVRLIQRDLGGRLLSVQEQERRRVARELHDDICQQLALLATEVYQAEHASNCSLVDMKRNLQGISTHCSQIAADVQSISHQLHSSNLEYLGIGAAVRGFCTEFSKMHDLLIDFTQRNLPKNLSEESALCLFRVVQEALNNARKHSGTTRLTVELWGEKDQVRLMVRDFGRGFDEEQVRMNSGLGVVSMRERLRLVGGSLSIQSRIGAGTSVLGIVPLPAERPDVRTAAQQSPAEKWAS